MTQVLIFDRLIDLHEIAEPWDCLRKDLPTYFPPFATLSYFLKESRPDFRVIALKSNGRIDTLACFVCEPTRKPYTVGERKLFSLPVRRVRLYGSAFLGIVDEGRFKKFLDIVRHQFSFDLLSFGEMPLGSSLHIAIRKAHSGFLLSSPYRKISKRWSINLPQSFDQYLVTLGSNSMKRTVRRMERKFKCDFVIFNRPEQIDQFLLDGEAISRRTYQWHLGQRLENNEETRRLYMQKARSDQLRCYILYASGKPCAFSRGELVDGIYHDETPGFDPQYAKSSPGLVLLMWVIKDLIENTNCKIFDFGQGGDEVGYKSIFGNVAVNCASLELGRWTSPYSLGVILLQEGLNASRNLASWILGNSRIRQKFKKAIRQYKN